MLNARAQCLDIASVLPPASRMFEPNKEAYHAFVKEGYKRMEKSRAVICGLARTLGDKLDNTIELVEATGQKFSDYGVVIFENDSADDTAAKLKEWASLSPRVDVHSQKLGTKHWPATRELGRMADLAAYRNHCRKRALELFADYDYVIVADTDLFGWSIDGIANSIGHNDWDFMGSVSWAKGKLGNWVHYDVWAFRNPDYMPLTARQVNPWLPRLGDPVVPVKSCFGGLGVYRMDAYKSACYAGTDCEHVCLHQGMAQAGFDRQFINPSQITIY